MPFSNGTSPTARFRTHARPTDDQNTGANPQTVAFRSPLVKVLFGDDDRAGYEVLPLVRLEKSDRPEASKPPRAASSWKAVSFSMASKARRSVETRSGAMPGGATTLLPISSALA